MNGVNSNILQGQHIVQLRNVKRKFKTVSERKPPGEFSGEPFAAEKFSPARGLEWRDRTLNRREAMGRLPFFVYVWKGLRIFPI